MSLALVRCSLLERFEAEEGSKLGRYFLFERESRPSDHLPFLAPTHSLPSYLCCCPRNYYLCRTAQTRRMMGASSSLSPSFCAMFRGAKKKERFDPSGRERERERRGIRGRGWMDGWISQHSDRESFFLLHGTWHSKKDNLRRRRKNGKMAPSVRSLGQSS